MVWCIGFSLSSHFFYVCQSTTFTNYSRLANKSDRVSVREGDRGEDGRGWTTPLVGARRRGGRGVVE